MCAHPDSKPWHRLISANVCCQDFLLICRKYQWIAWNLRCQKLVDKLTAIIALTVKSRRVSNEILVVFEKSS